MERFYQDESRRWIYHREGVKNVFTIFEKNSLCACGVCCKVNLFLIFVEEINLKAAVYPTVLCLAFDYFFLLWIFAV